MKQYQSAQFGRFLIVGGVAAAVNTGSRVIYNLWTSYSAAIVLAYVTGMVTAFSLSRVYVFTTSRNTTAQSAIFFVLVNCFAILQTWTVSILLAEYLLPALGIPYFNREIAHMVGVAVPVFTSYIGHRQLSFR